MGTPFGSKNIGPDAIDIDSPEFAARFGDADDDSHEAPNGSFDAPADFDADAQEVPEIIRAMNAPKKAKKAAQTAKDKAAAAKAKERAAAAKAKEREAAKARREKAAEEKKAAREAAKAEKAKGPDLTGLVPTKAAQKATVQNVPVELLDGIDGGDPVDKAFVDNVSLHGILQPIRVRATEDGRFNIVYGKRRSQAARAAGFATIPAVVEKDASANDYVQGLAENYSRSNNVIEEHRMVMALIDYYRAHGDTGANDRKAVAAIARATGMTTAQIKKARDVGRLVPELMQAVEEGAMSSWSALNAARLPIEAQRRLVDTLNEEGRVTADDVVVARRHKQHEAVAAIANGADSAGESMFDAPDTGDTGADAAPTGTRTERVAAVVVKARQALEILQGLNAKSDDEQDAIVLLTQVVENLTTAAG